MADVDPRRGPGGSKQYDDRDRYQVIPDRHFGWRMARGGWELPRKAEENYTVMRRVSWGSYTNARFQYTIRYPRDLLIPQVESDNTLGQTLARIETDTVGRLAGNSGTVTYRRLQPAWFVFSGVTDDKIFNAKTHLVGDMQKSFEFTYPRENADVYRAVTARIVTSFRSLGSGR